VYKYIKKIEYLYIKPSKINNRMRVDLRVAMYKAIYEALLKLNPTIDICTLYIMLNQLCPLDVDPKFDFRHLPTKQLRDLQRYYRNPTPAKQTYIALQYGIHATIAMAVSALNKEIGRRTKAVTTSA
jgi:hypothetical protein